MRRKRASLLRGMLRYGLFLALLMTVGLLILSKFLYAYEASRPARLVQEYFAGLSDAQLDELSAESLSELDPAIRAGDDSRAYLRQLTREARPARAASEGEQLVYVLARDGQALGKLVMTPEGRGDFGFTEYAIHPEGFDYRFLFQEQSVTVPEDWQVICDGTPLGADHVTETHVPYPLLKAYYGDGDYELPYLKTCRIGPYLLEPTLRFVDALGREQTELSEEAFADNCSAAAKKEIRQLTEDFLLAYIRFSSNASRVYMKYQQLEKLMVPGSELQKRMYSAIEGLQWARSGGDSLQELEIHHMMDLGGGCYFCDATYINESIGKKGAVETTNNVRLILRRMDSGELLVDSMSSY